MREAVGPHVGLMIEFHGRLSAGGAVRHDPAAGALRRRPGARSRSRPRASICWPRSSDRSRTPIAAGERLYTLADFYRLTALRAADVVQMDLAHCGGILASKKIAAMAAAQDLRVAPHCSVGPVALAACLHFDVSTPNFLIQEAFAEFDVPWRDELVARLEPDQKRRVHSVATRLAWASISTRMRSPSTRMCRTPFLACGTATG